MKILNTLIEKLKKLPLWLKNGILLGIFMTAFLDILPDTYTNSAYRHWLIDALVFIPQVISLLLCLIFGVDFISNYSDGEVLRPILLATFSYLSIFVAYFIIGALLSITIRNIRGRRIGDRC